MKPLVFADGTSVDSHQFLYHSELHQIYIGVDGLSIVEACSIFSDRNKTKSMTREPLHYDNLTKLINIAPKEGGSIVVLMEYEAPSNETILEVPDA